MQQEYLELFIDNFGQDSSRVNYSSLQGAAPFGGRTRQCIVWSLSLAWPYDVTVCQYMYVHSCTLHCISIPPGMGYCVYRLVRIYEKVLCFITTLWGSLQHCVYLVHYILSNVFIFYVKHYEDLTFHARLYLVTAQLNGCHLN